MAILALGRHLLFHELTGGRWVVAIAVVAIILLIRFWGPLLGWLGRRHR